MSKKSDKISIVFILPDLESGGAERIVTTIANHLSRQKFLPRIMLLRKEGDYLELVREDVEIIDLKVRRIRESLLPILRYIRQEKPDIVFSGFGEVNAYISLFLKLFSKTKFIARETNVVSRHVTRPEIRFFYRYYNNYNHIVCQSDDMLNDLVKKFGIRKEKIVKINNPVDFDLVREMTISREKPENFTKGFRHVVAVGNLSYRKGFDNLLKVFYQLKGEKVRLHILGDGRDREILETMKTELGLDQVFFYGRQKNPFAFLKFSDLFILSSRYEGFPNALLEAGACGVYSLANKCPGGIREIIEPGINGDVADIEDHKSFAEKILDILENPHDKSAIIHSIYSRFSKEIILKKYEALFLQV